MGKTIIAIGTDEKVFERGNIFARQKDYFSLAEFYVSFVFVKNKNLQIIKEDNFKIIPVYAKYKPLAFFKLFFIARKEVKGKNTVFTTQDSFEIGLLGFVMSKIYRAKLALQIHTDISSVNFRNESSRNYMQFLLANLLIKRADHVRVVSKRMEKYLRENLGISKEKIFLLPIYANVLEKQNFQSENKLEKKTDFLIMSRIEKVKNIELAIEAVKTINLERVKRQLGNLSLKIVGDGSYKKYLQEKYNSGLDENKFIIWEGWVTNVEKEYVETRYFLLPSLYEGWGMTAVESVAVGTPVLMTNVGCAGEFITNEVNGFVSESFNVDAFVNTINKAINFSFSEDRIRNSLMSLQTKEEYLTIMKKFLTFN